MKNEDIATLQKVGIDETEINKQKSLLLKNDAYVKIIAPATPENGIRIVENQSQYIDNYIQKSKAYKVCKFVPASGAATRMFKRLIAFNLEPNLKNLHDGGFYSVKNTFDNISKFAFFKVLKTCMDCPENLEKISDKILNEPLKYASLPKGLIDFHQYDKFSRTAFEEQLYEAVALSEVKTPANIEFTVSKEHFEMFKNLLDKILKESELNVSVKFSFQEKSTDTIAIYEDNNIVRDEDGNLYFRPGGHGSLLQNLNKIDADIVFIKNIDNIVHESYLQETLPYKKLLGGILIEVVEKIKYYTELLLSDSSKENLNSATDYLEKTFCTKFNRNSETFTNDLLQFMNRPIRVCGMVKNTGEPGGGPFFVESNGVQSLQIVEKAQINLSCEDQNRHFVNSTHFNPVDLVCYIKNPQGEKFNLREFVDESTCFISEKTYKGKNIKVLEHPGLWNGSMANWMTIFVEVPLITFNPVKELNDLLRPEHLTK